MALLGWWWAGGCGWAGGRGAAMPAASIRLLLERHGSVRWPHRHGALYDADRLPTSKEASLGLPQRTRRGRCRSDGQDASALRVANAFVRQLVRKLSATGPYRQENRPADLGEHPSRADRQGATM